MHQSGTAMSAVVGMTVSQVNWIATLCGSGKGEKLCIRPDSRRAGGKESSAFIHSFIHSFVRSFALCTYQIIFFFQFQS